MERNFNVEGDEPCLSNFLYQQDLSNLAKVGTCFKNPSKLTFVDLFLTIKNWHLRNTTELCSGLSDFHKLVLIVLKTSFGENKPREILYRDHKKFSSESFNEHLQNMLSKNQLKTCK